MQKIGTIVWVGLEIGVQNPDFAGVGFCSALLSRATGPYPARHKTTCARLTTQTLDRNAEVPDATRSDLERGKNTRKKLQTFINGKQIINLRGKPDQYLSLSVCGVTA